MSIGVSLCTVEYNQCCVYSKINTYETLTHHKGSSGVCSKNNWNTECILNMYHTPIFWIIVWFINLNYLLNGESIIMGKTIKCSCKIMYSFMLRTDILIWNRFFIAKNLTKIGIRLFSYCKLKKIFNHNVVLMQIITLFNKITEILESV